MINGLPSIVGPMGRAATATLQQQPPYPSVQSGLMPIEDLIRMKNLSASIKNAVPRQVAPATTVASDIKGEVANAIQQAQRARMQQEQMRRAAMMQQAAPQGIPTLPASNVGNEAAYAAGGIVAFAGGDAVRVAETFVDDLGNLWEKTATGYQQVAGKPATGPAGRLRSMGQALRSALQPSILNPNIGGSARGLGALAKGAGKFAAKASGPLAAADLASTAFDLYNTPTEDIAEYYGKQPGESFLGDIALRGRAALAEAIPFGSSPLSDIAEAKRAKAQAAAPAVDPLTAQVAPEQVGPPPSPSLPTVDDFFGAPPSNLGPRPELKSLYDEKAYEQLRSRIGTTDREKALEEERQAEEKLGIGKAGEGIKKSIERLDKQLGEDKGKELASLLQTVGLAMATYKDPYGAKTSFLDALAAGGAAGQKAMADLQARKEKLEDRRDQLMQQKATYEELIASQRLNRADARVRANEAESRRVEGLVMAAKQADIQAQNTVAGTEWENKQQADRRMAEIAQQGRNALKIEGVREGRAGVAATIKAQSEAQKATLKQRQDIQTSILENDMALAAKVYAGDPLALQELNRRTDIRMNTGVQYPTDIQAILDKAKQARTR